MSRRTGFSDEVRQIVADRSLGACERCGEYASDGQLHHRRPRQHGGTRRPETNLASNALWLCLMCHTGVESYRAEAYDNGWLVRSQQDPVTTPVLYRGQLVLLDSDGFVYPIPTRKEA